MAAVDMTADMPMNPQEMWDHVSDLSQLGDWLVMHEAWRSDLPDELTEGVQIVGVARAKDLVFTGRQVRAEEALRIGLVDRVVGRHAVLDEALALATSLARGPRMALAAAKRVIDEGIERPLEEALAAEVSAFVAVADTVDARAGLSSFRRHGPGRARFVGR